MQGITHNDLKDFKCLEKFKEWFIDRYPEFCDPSPDEINMGETLFDLPLELQLGVFLAWFKEEGIESLYDTQNGGELGTNNFEGFGSYTQIGEGKVTESILATFAHIDKREQ